MPYKNPEKARVCNIETKRRMRERERLDKYGTLESQRGRHGNNLRGSSHYRWNRGKILDDAGYVKIRVGRNHPLADPNGYAYEHHVVWFSAGNPPLKEGELIHHKNEDKQDNRYENLELKSKGDHNHLHIMQRGRDFLGRFLPKKDGSTWEEKP